MDFVLEAVKALLRDHKCSLDTETLIHSDQGSHYKSIKFIELLRNNGLRQSMSRKDNCWNNAPQESFFGHMKDELNIKHCKTHDDIKHVIGDWVDYYNTKHYKWELAKLSPNEYYDYAFTGRYPLRINEPNSAGMLPSYTESTNS
ncbi:MAG: IS3 family transposase [Dehalococcoidia bacterium]|nr:IS3 family transposase [Dehalococcoidia bacterium]